MSKVVNDLLKKANPAICSVTGRPRRPQDQGSIENLNRQIKRILNSFDQEDRLNNREPNWTNKLGRLMAALNSQEQKGKWAVFAYEAVYGQTYNGNEQWDQE